MVKWMKVFILLCVWGWVSAAGAQEVYVSGITKITMRIGPGVERKIVAMLESGSRLEILEYQADWSLVQTEDQKQGWVLTRFLTEDKPLILEVNRLRRENERLAAELEDIETDNQDLVEKNAALAGIEKKYQDLAQASAEFIELKEKYRALVQKSEDQEQQISLLQDNLSTEAMLWFLSGAGVFIVGLILGLSTRKKKRSLL